MIPLEKVTVIEFWCFGITCFQRENLPQLCLGGILQLNIMSARNSALNGMGKLATLFYALCNPFTWSIWINSWRSVGEVVAQTSPINNTRLLGPVNCVYSQLKLIHFFMRTSAIIYGVWLWYANLKTQKISLARVQTQSGARYHINYKLLEYYFL